ncbi:hypothetical protein [Actinoplanes xinjiangensis]|uniref:Uncharacterized protein n=1 Tax=Actinoplanes xinjiangensis TaxID=512350 RepID=A0A316FJ46_9ACTN|nr:hypothetical protein [Actinoplanes xinjiangensis]PWK48155.1 hypothetical protein BC793_106182 [Actinoplanes xinjiangensis]GIF39091.1 hypothetical protein Axi01nite_34020 [Actinoplanes xinjiangensis]
MDEKPGTDAGSSTDQHVTGADETEDMPVDAEPTADTPAHGSSNAVFNAARDSVARDAAARERG